MKILILLFFLFVMPILSTAQDNESEIDLDASLNYNINGNAKFNNLTPVVFFGWKQTLANNKLRIVGGPVAAAQIDLTDSSSFIPALMLPGSLELSFLLYYNYKGNYDNKESDGEGLNFFGGPGLKITQNFLDNDGVIIQHYLRTGLNYKWKEILLVGTSFTFGWHNLVEQPEENFKTVFITQNTGMTYVKAYIQTKVSPKKQEQDKESTLNTYLFLEWRSLLNSGDFNDIFTNRKILSIGIRTSISATDSRNEGK